MNINGLSLTDSMTFNIELENEQNKSIQKANSKQIELTVVCGL